MAHVTPHTASELQAIAARLTAEGVRPMTTLGSNEQLLRIDDQTAVEVHGRSLWCLKSPGLWERSSAMP